MVSIIVPNYNHVKFLKQRLESIINQTYQDFEIILLDDASSDSSLEILNNYKNHPKVSHFIVNEENSGSVFKQWAKGIQLAKGDYVWIAESDDYADVNFLEETIKLMKSDPSFGMVFSESTVVDDNGVIGNELSTQIESIKEFKKNNYIINNSNITKFLLQDLVIRNASSVLFLKKALIEMDLNNLIKFKSTGDRFTYISIALNYNIYFFKTPLNFIRLHDNNTTKVNRKNGLIFRDRIRIIDLFLSDLIKEKRVENRELLSYFMELYFPSIQNGYVIGLRSTLKDLYKKTLINSRQYALLSIYSFVPINSYKVKKRIKTYILE